MKHHTQKLKNRIKIGIDEVGRGAWAGPLVACALAFDANTPPSESFLQTLQDSKKLTKKKREYIFDELIEASQNGNVYFGLGVVDAEFVDAQGVKAANKEAMRRAIVEIQRKIPQHFTHISVVIDGNDAYTFDELSQQPLYIVGGDGKVEEISGASILAKVFRDRIMCVYASLYPHYAFADNVGYGTQKHTQKLQKASDISGIHRKSYAPVKKILEAKQKVLIHICCGPDSTVPFMDLKKNYEVIAYWYNPNIHPYKEYKKRFDAFKKVCRLEGISYIEGDYDITNFFENIKGLEHTPERGEKCTNCYDMRLARTAKLAREMGIRTWTSTLNTSPHKDLEKMFTLGEKWDKIPYENIGVQVSQKERQQAAQVLGLRLEEYEENISKNISHLNPFSAYEETKATQLQEKLEFLKIAFRKNGGFQRSVDYTNKHGIYRQNYCGCVYSDTFPGNSKVKNARGGLSG